MKFKFSQFPVLTTERLSLRQITKADSPTVFYLRTDQEINKYIHRPKPHQTVQEAEAFIDKIMRGTEKGENINWAITMLESREMIGSICLWNFSKDRKTAEVGYDLALAYQNQGIMSEALKCVVGFGFDELSLHEIEAFTHARNEGSKRLLQKNNFKLNESRSDPDNQNNLIFELKNKKNI